MKMNYNDLVAKTTLEVFSSMLNVEALKGKQQKMQNKFSAKKVNVSIAFLGDIKGFVYFSMTKKTALNIAEKMSGMELKSFDDFSSSAISEMANIILGNFSTKVSQKNVKTNITPPSLAIGDNIKMSVNKGNFVLIPIFSEVGTVDLNIVFNVTP